MGTELAKKKIREHLTSLKIQTIDKYFGWGLFFSIGGAIVGLTLCLLFLFFLNLVFIILGPIVLVLSSLVAYLFFNQIPKIKEKNLKILLESGQYLHQIFFDAHPNPFPNLDFKFLGIYPSTIWNYNSLHFTLGSEAIIWDVDEDIETQILSISGRYGSTTQGQQIYFLKYNFFSTAKKLNGIQEVIVSAGPTPKKQHKYFEFESIEFSERFKVQGQSPFDVYRIFTPQVIDNFLSLTPEFLGSESIILHNGCISSNHRILESKKSCVPQPLDYSAIRWSKKQMVDQIYKKLDLDFGRYLQVQKLLMPLDLY